MSQIEGYILSCKWCASLFAICKRCYRGHRYCCEVCRRHGYEKSRKVARHRHEASIEARLDHRDRQRRYRKSQSENTVTDKGSILNVAHLSSRGSTHLKIENLPEVGVCVGCGQTLWTHVGV